MRLLLFSSVLSLSVLSTALPTENPDQHPKPSGLTLPALDTSPPQAPDIFSFIASAPDYIVKAFSISGTACSISRVLPIFCGEQSLDERMATTTTAEMSGPAAAAAAVEETAACGSGFEGWVCSVLAHTSLIAFVFLIVAPLLGLGVYKWKKAQKPRKKLPLPLSEPQGPNGYSQVEEIRSKWMPMSPL